MDIADDVLLAAKELARHQGRSAGHVISELARGSLLRASTPGCAGGTENPDEFFGFRPLPSRGVVVTNELINRLREEDGC